MLSLCVAAASLGVGPRASIGQEWFLHPYGELRAYHGDWLAVCNDRGEGPCRAVQIVLEPGETRVGPARLSLEQNASGGLDVVFFHILLMAGIADPLVLDLDGEEWTLTPDQWSPGEPGLPNVIGGFHLSDSALAGVLVRRMQVGQRLVLRHPAV